MLVDTSAGTWIKKAWLLCWPLYSQQVSHQRWILRNSAQARKCASVKSTLALEFRADVSRSPKPGHQWRHEKDLCPQIFFLKMSNLLVTGCVEKRMINCWNFCSDLLLHIWKFSRLWKFGRISHRMRYMYMSCCAKENIGPLWKRKYYVIPPQGLCNITSSIEAHNNRNVNHHSVITIDDDVTLNCQKLWWRLWLAYRKVMWLCPKTMVESPIGSQNSHMTFTPWRCLIDRLSTSSS